MRISDWSSDVCSSDLPDLKDFKVDGSVTLSRFGGGTSNAVTNNEQRLFVSAPLANDRLGLSLSGVRTFHSGFLTDISPGSDRSEEHTSELQSLMRISYAVFCLKKKNCKEIDKKQPQLASNVSHLLHTLST